MGKYDSSKTRVQPVFDLLAAQTAPWVARLLSLPEGAHRDAQLPDDLALTFQSGYWSPREKMLDPPVALLSWLIRNIPVDAVSSDPIPERRELGARDPETVQKALKLLRSSGERRGWYIFEGPTSPDVVIETPDSLIVIEGKRTEAGPTTKTSWLAGRHQIWRHIDAAWEVRGARRVYGFFIVEGGDSADDVAVPDVWRQAFDAALHPDCMASSFPHRSQAECSAIAACFLGGTTWQAVCRCFSIDYASLPHESR